MATDLPVVTIQCDWNDVIRLPGEEAWISSKSRKEASVHEKLTTCLCDGKLKINFSDNFQYISHGPLSLIVKHIPSDLRVAFVAPTKAHKIHNKAVLSVASAENALVISSSEDDKVLVWDSRTSEVNLDLKGHGGPVYRCKFFPSGLVVLTAGADGSSRIWSAECGVNPTTLKGHIMAVTDICFVDKGRNVISVSKDGCGKLWDVGESNCLDNVVDELGQINCCAITTTTDVVQVPNEREVGTGNKLLVVGCESGLVVCAHVARRIQMYSKQLDSPCNALIILQDHIIVGHADGKITQLSLKTGDIENVWHESANPVISMAVLLNHLFVIGRQDGTCTVMSLLPAFKKLRIQLTGSDCDGIRDLSFNGKWIFAACRDCYVRKYDFNQINVHYKQNT